MFDNRLAAKLYTQPALLAASMLLSLLSISVPAQKKFIHPGLTNSRAELDFIKAKVNAGAEPWKSGYEKMMSHNVSSLSYQARPCESIGFRSCNDPIRNDSASAYSHALQYYIKGNRANGEKAAQILNAWAEKNTKGINPRNSSDRGCLVSSWGFHRMLAGAEILRASYSGWSSADQSKFVNYIRMIYPQFSQCHSGGNNHDTSGRMSEVMAAIFIDDREKYEASLNRQKSLVASYIMDPKGCTNESDRDQGHSQMGISQLAETAEAAWHQGDDLYGAHGNRIYHAFEFAAKYNLGNSVDESGCQKGQSSQFRGKFQPIYEMAYNHYHNRKGMPMPWTAQVIKKIRPEGLDDKMLGWGTLTYAELGKVDDTKPTPTPQPSSFSIPLQQGWNLISLPLQPDNTEPATVLAGINGKYSAVYAYDAVKGQYQSHTPGSTDGDLKSIEAGRGYWIYMSDSGTLELKGTAAAKSVELESGWNLVGFNSTGSASIEQALSSINGRYSAIYAFDTASNSYRGHVPGGTSDLTKLEGGKGYWIFAPQDVTWTLP